MMVATRMMEVPTHVLHSLHPLDVQQLKLASTVRKGFKWASTAKLGDALMLCVCRGKCLDPERCGKPKRNGTPWSCEHCTIQGKGVVTGFWVGRFEDIPALFLDYEHEASSRTYSGLLKSMRRAYGQFGPHDWVTVLMYQVLEFPLKEAK
jgi:hypothetical protein